MADVCGSAATLAGAYSDKFRRHNCQLIIRKLYDRVKRFDVLAADMACSIRSVGTVLETGYFNDTCITAGFGGPVRGDRCGLLDL